jgi:hypothetical protein
LHAHDQYADNQVPLHQVLEAGDRVWQAPPASLPLDVKWTVLATLRKDITYWTRDSHNQATTAREEGMMDAKELAEGYARRASQCDSLRCLFGPLPFRPITLDPPWLTTTVKQLAEAIYQERAFDRLPILADALEDAGCNQQDIVGHLRSSGEHVRGCWALDVVLGRE